MFFHQQNIVRSGTPFRTLSVSVNQKQKMRNVALMHLSLAYLRKINKEANIWELTLLSFLATPMLSIVT